MPVDVYPPVDQGSCCGWCLLVLCVTFTLVACGVRLHSAESPRESVGLGLIALTARSQLLQTAAPLC